jgi:hypothetical protein
METVRMNRAMLLLNAYYEVLYNRLTVKKGSLSSIIDKLLRAGIQQLEITNLEEGKYVAYHDVCWAFVDERLEMYNPIGVHYTFDCLRTKEAIELELHFDWYDSGQEFEILMRTVRDRADVELFDERLHMLANELIREVGAFPNKSIISAYEAAPALNKLPDYVVAKAIETVIHDNDFSHQ